MKLDTICNCDCLDGMRDIPTGSVDLIVTDPPYDLLGSRSVSDYSGAGAFGKMGRAYHGAIASAGLAGGITEEYLLKFERVMKATNIYLFCNKNQLRMYFNFYANKNCDLLVWHKLNPIPTVNGKYLSDIEYIFFARDKGVNLGGNYSTLSKVYESNVNKKDAELYGHPTIKPLPLVRRLILNSSKACDVVLDPFLGSGTTAVACVRENRHFLGFEINKTYYDIAQRRIDAVKRQKTLF